MLRITLPNMHTNSVVVFLENYQLLQYELTGGQGSITIRKHLSIRLDETITKKTNGKET